jgi:hypothetical protein
VKPVIAAFVLLSGCAAVQPPAKPAAAALGPGEIPSARAGEDALAIGKSTKAEVRAALGEATVVDFASGYEVWVYREPAQEKEPAAKAELVLLFAPSGILTRTRVR